MLGGAKIMAKAIYQKYNSVLSSCSTCGGKKTVSCPKFVESKYMEQGSGGFNSNLYYNYSFDSTTGMFTGVNPITIPLDSNVSGIVYMIYYGKNSQMRGLCARSGNPGDVGIEYYNYWSYSSSKCSVCNGTGTKTCPSCNGTGIYDVYSKGSYVGNAIVDYGTLPTNGRGADGFWYIYQSIVPPTAPPSLTLPTQITGGKPNTILWTAATSEGAVVAGYILQRSLDGGAFTQIYKGNALTYADVVIYGSNTVQYRVCAYDVDGQNGEFTTSELKTVVNNNPPVISGADVNKGAIAEGFSFAYSVTDEDTTDTIKITEAIDGVTLRTFDATKATTYTANVTANTWLSLLNASHMLTITAVDNRGGTAVRTITFTKAVNEIEFSLQTPLACDAMVTKTIMQVSREIPVGADFEVYVCNNAYDTTPTRQDVTQKVISGDKIFFANTTKTAVQWGYNIKVIIRRKTAQGLCYVTAVSGNFE